MRLHRFSRLILLVLALSLATQAAAWGHLGHEIVGRIADLRLTGTPTEERLRKILHADESLATVASWADCVKGPDVCKSPLNREMDGFIHRFPHHRTFHYADVPSGRLQYEGGSVGTREEDVVQVLQDAVRTLQHSPDAKMGFTEREALFLVVHLVGDLHQPLHVGSAYLDAEGHRVDPRTQEEARLSSTDGANRVCVGKRSLHSLWDDEGPEALRRTHKFASVTAMADFLRAKGPLEALHDPAKAIEDWATESVKISDRMLRFPIESVRPAGAGRQLCTANNERGQKKVWEVSLSRADHADIDRISIEQLARAGERLARLFTSIWSH
jgi:hypothetical protein